MSTSLTNVTNTNPIVVGEDATLALTELHTNTKVDEVRVWNTALSSSEVAATAAVSLCTASIAPPPFPSNLVLHARFNEGTGTSTTNGGIGSPAAGTVAGAGVWQAASLVCG